MEAFVFGLPSAALGLWSVGYGLWAMLLEIDFLVLGGQSLSAVSSVSEIASENDDAN